MSGAENTKRRPPYYQVYGADLMNDERYYRLNATQRGVFDSIRNACWSNDSVPADAAELALALRLPGEVVAVNMKALMDSKLVAQASTPDRLHVPELTEQMRQFLEKRKQNVANAAKGGRTTQQRSREARSSDRSTDRSSGLKCNDLDCDEVEGSALKGVYREASDSTVDQLPVDRQRDDDHDDFVRAYDEEEARMAAGMVSARPSRARVDAAH